MPELPDITVYLRALESRVLGHRLERVRLASPFLLRSVTPPLAESHGKQVVGLSRLGKRVVLELEEEHFLVLHLMIAGRLQWKEPGAAIPGKVGLASLDFAPGALVLTEAGSKKRSSLYFLHGHAALQEHQPGGLEVLDAGVEAFREALRRESHTLKRALTDPHLFSGIGNAYSDEILHRARLSPVQLTRNLDDAEIRRLHRATRDVLQEWTERLLQQTGTGFPSRVTAFRPEMAVHGKYGQPCPECATPVQRIVFASNETNYCPTCQTGGKLLADRALSRLLQSDWPRTLEELEERRKRLQE